MQHNKYPNLDQRWEICKSYLQNKGATEMAKSSFDAFIDREFLHCIYNTFRINTKIGLDLKKNFTVKCTNVKIQPPILLNNDIDIQTPEKMTSNATMCRLLRSSLVSAVYINLSFEYNGKTEQCNNLLLCYVPIMVGSSITKKTHKKLNIVDDGYFILNGQEKIIVMQKRKIDRAVLVQNNKCHFTIPLNDQTWWLEETDETIMMRSKVGDCDVAIVLSELDFALNQIFPLKLRQRVKQWKEKSPQERLYKFKSVFPRESKINIEHLFQSSDKAWEMQLLYMCKSLGENIDTFDRDHIAYIRIESVSELLLCIARKSIKRVVTSFQKKILNYIEKNPNKNILKGISRALDARIVTESFFYSLGTGNWDGRTGVCQQRSNYNFNSILSQSRRIRAGDEKRAIIAERSVRGDQFGYLCGYDTSEGKSCGINKHLATMATVSIEFSDDIILNILQEKQYLKKEIDLRQKHLIFLNGRLVKQAPNGQTIVKLKQELQQYRRMGVIDRGVSISHNFDCLHIRSDAGRLLRPLFIVQNLVAHMQTSNFRPDFDNLVKGGIIEYVDSFEEDNLLVCFDLNDENILTCTHCEIHPCLSLSMNTNANNPYCNHNQGPRLTYQNAMQKQAQSQIVENYRDLMYSRSHYLFYGQKALAATKVSQTEGMPQGSGLNAICAIMPWDGHNQEDSLCISEAFIQRGGFRTLDYKCFSYSGSEKIGKDIMNQSYRRNNVDLFRHCDDDGLPTPGRRLQADDIILAKEIPPEEADHIDDENVGQDTSQKARDKKGVIDRVIIGSGRRRRKGPGEKSYKVQITSYEMRIPEVGDKLASRHAQKGVCSYIVPEEDLPFIGHSGIKPDIILSVHAIPTRMTVGHLMEMLGAKLAAVSGNIEDATAFTSKSVTQLGAEMKKYGFSKYGCETLIDGKTGEMLTGSKIFMGPVYYQRLRHMVKDKLHVRTHGGPRSCLTRMPPPGKLNRGGHRVGEMESVALIGSGASMTHRTMWRQSDPSVWARCKDCGLYNNQKQTVCLHCKGENLEVIEIPFCFKLLQQELLQCGILTK
jgi:DNA-directed RNA polymerase II subunit RPB2